MNEETITTNAADKGEKPAGKLTPELVQKVADKVYALWQRDLRYEQERTYRHDRAVYSNRWQR